MTQEEAYQKFCVGKKLKHVPLFIPVGDYHTINPYWVFFAQVTVGQPKDLTLDYLAMEGHTWTDWHEVWFFHFTLLELCKSGISRKRLSEKLAEVKAAHPCLIEQLVIYY